MHHGFKYSFMQHRINIWVHSAGTGTGRRLITDACGEFFKLGHWARLILYKLLNHVQTPTRQIVMFLIFSYLHDNCCCVLQTSFCNDFQLWSNFKYVRHNKPSTMSVNWYRSLHRWVTFIHNATSLIWKMTIRYGNGVELLMEIYCHNCLRVLM